VRKNWDAVEVLLLNMNIH